MACSSCTYWSGPFMFEEGVSWAEPFSLHQCTSLLLQRRLWLGGKRALHMRTPRYNCLYTGKSYFSNIRIFSCWLLDDQKLLVRRKCFFKNVGKNLICESALCCDHEISWNNHKSADLQLLLWLLYWHYFGSFNTNFSSGIWFNCSARSFELNWIR